MIRFPIAFLLVGCVAVSAELAEGRPALFDFADGARTEAEAQAAQKAWASHHKLDAVTQTNSIGMKFALIPPGIFTMGSPASEQGRSNDETPHGVKLTKAFLMGVTEVTQAQWKAVMGENPSHFKGDDLPVEQVSWDEATAFCRKLSEKEGKRYRLPTEAEWEYACRAGTTTAYHTGGDERALAETGWYGAYERPAGNSGKQTNRVGQKRASAWGLHDMHGNVWEWCGAWYGEYHGGEATDPTGPATGSSRVLRGGSWNNRAVHCRAGFRYRFATDHRDNDIGFRVVLELTE